MKTPDTFATLHWFAQIGDEFNVTVSNDNDNDIDSGGGKFTGMRLLKII